VIKPAIDLERAAELAFDLALWFVMAGFFALVIVAGACARIL
jgi:hypothetical protein